jgi:hypothetical protein
MIRRWLVGFAMALALGSAVGVTLLDLIDHPHDWWAVVTFLSGTLVGWAWDHRGRKTPRP